MQVTSRHHAGGLTFSRKTFGHIFLAACLFFGVSAQLLLKFGMLQIQAYPETWLSYGVVLGGLGVYAAGTGCWMLCLGYLDLSYAYPFTGLTYIVVLGASWSLFGDGVSLPRVVGVVLICLGVTLLPIRSR